MSPVDIQIITRKAKLIEVDLAILAKNQPKSYKQYLKSATSQLIIERLLERIVGKMIDINYHLLSERCGFVPNNYTQSFTELGKRGIVSEKLANELAKSGGLRNALAHEYDEIDPKKIYESIEMALTQVPKYLKSVLKKIYTSCHG